MFDILKKMLVVHKFSLFAHVESTVSISMKTVLSGSLVESWTANTAPDMHTCHRTSRVSQPHLRCFWLCFDFPSTLIMEGMNNAQGDESTLETKYFQEWGEWAALLGKDGTSEYSPAQITNWFKCQWLFYKQYPSRSIAF